MGKERQSGGRSATEVGEEALLSRARSLLVGGDPTNARQEETSEGRNRSKEGGGRRWAGCRPPAPSRLASYPGGGGSEVSK
jgi:hypothetical protein